MPAEKIREPVFNRLHLYTLGRFEIYHKDKGFYSISGRATKQWYLFKYLLLNKGKKLPPETIFENLYPDEAYENPKNTLKNIVYRLRKLFDQDDFFRDLSFDILYNNGCYSLYFDDDVFVDTDLFEEYIQKAELLKNIKPDEAIKFYESAVMLYKGDYFPELIYEDWVLPKRNYYHRLYVNSVLQLIELYQKKKEYDKIIMLCEQAIQIEPYEEELHVRFIEKLVEKGRVKEAQNQYRLYTSMLYKQFGLKPTAELQQVYRQIKNSGDDFSGTCLAKNSAAYHYASGAFYCDRNLFSSIFDLEKRRSERTGNMVFAVSVTVNETSDIFGAFRENLIKSLRRGDVVTTWDSNVLFVLLQGMDYRQVITIMNRIIKQFNKNNSSYNIEVKILTALPDEVKV